MLRNDKKHSNSPRKIIFGTQIGATVEILEVKIFSPLFLSTLANFGKLKSFFLSDDTHFWQFCGILDTVRSVLSTKDFIKTIFLTSYIFLTGEGGEISPNKIEKYGNFEMKLERVNQQ